MRIVCISDTHGMHAELDPLPEGDVLIHAGDFCRAGKETEFIDFNKWIAKQNFAHKLVVPGNHDLLFAESSGFARTLLPDCTLLIDEAITLASIKFYGSPWTPRLHHMNWAFGEDRGSDAIYRRRESIPNDIDILISHGPAHGILDVEWDEHLGDESLRHKLSFLNKLKYMIFGHIHGSYGLTRHFNTTFVNAAMCSHEKFKIINQPIILDVKG